jgi:hypothetical protein
MQSIYEKFKHKRNYYNAPTSCQIFVLAQYKKTFFLGKALNQENLYASIPKQMQHLFDFDIVK